jgi:hypothetical protein
MSKLNSRAKGQTGEREVADMLNGAIYRATNQYGDFKRNLQQTQDGGFDLFSERFPYFAFEVKRVENLTPGLLDSFWQQALRQSTAVNAMTSRGPNAYLPVLIYRRNRNPWRVRTYGSICWNGSNIVVDVAINDFITWFETQIRKIEEKRLVKTSG